MTTYLTWLPDEIEAKGFPVETKHFRAFNACRPAGAAAQAAMRASTPKHPYSVEIMVMRADRLGRNDGPGPRTYHVEFERSVKKVEAIR